MLMTHQTNLGLDAGHSELCESTEFPICPICNKPAHATETDDLDRHPECLEQEQQRHDRQFDLDCDDGTPLCSRCNGPKHLCELCGEHPCEQYSWDECDEHGRGMVLCHPCCAAIDAMPVGRALSLLRYATSGE